MKFYDRKHEIEILQEIEELSSEYAQMTMMVGRRRIGKTTLLKNAFMKTPVLYFFVGRKNEVLLLRMQCALLASWARFWVRAA